MKLNRNYSVETIAGQQVLLPAVLEGDVQRSVAAVPKHEYVIIGLTVSEEIVIQVLAAVFFTEMKPKGTVREHS